MLDQIRSWSLNSDRRSPLGIAAHRLRERFQSNIKSNIHLRSTHHQHPPHPATNR